MPNVTLDSLARQIADFAVAIDARVDGLESKMAARVDGLESAMTARIDVVDQRLERIESKLDRALQSRGCTRRTPGRRRPIRVDARCQVPSAFRDSRLGRWLS
jgi:hypothetical protein